jgi:Na+/H+-dicarboxylate symporter
MMKIDSPYRESIRNFWEGMYQVMMKLTDFIMKFAPIGVFALVAKTISTTGFSASTVTLVFSNSVCGTCPAYVW